MMLKSLCGEHVSKIHETVNIDMNPFDVPLQKSNEQRDKVREVYEYRDAEGKLACKAEAEYGPMSDEEARYISCSGRMLTGLKIKGDKGMVDVFELTGASGITIIVPDALLKACEYHDDRRSILALRLDNLLNLGSLLHELGHAIQYREESYEAITSLYYWGNAPVADVPSDTLDEMLAAVSEAKALAPLVDRLKNLREKVAKLRQDLSSEATSDSLSLQKELHDALAEIHAIDASHDLERLIKAPQRMMERDATSRALIWLRSIRMITGADVLGHIRIKAEEYFDPKKDFDDSCASSVRLMANRNEPEKVLTIQENLARAYRGYGATSAKMRIKKAGEAGPGKMPRMGK